MTVPTGPHRKPTGKRLPKRLASPPPRSAARGRRLALALLGAGGVVLLAEAAASLWLEHLLGSRPPLSQWQRSFDPAVGDGLPRSARSRRSAHPEDPSALYALRRFPAAGGAARGARLRVLALGDPVAAAGAPAAVVSWSHRLGEALSRGGVPVEVASAGLPGDSSSQQLLRLVAISARYRPDVVVALGGGEDLRFAVNPFFRDPDNVLAAPVFLEALQPPSPGVTPFLRYGDRRLIVCRLFCMRSPSALELLLRHPASQMAAPPPGGPWPARPAVVPARLPETDLRRAVGIWQRNAEAMQALAALHGARFVLALQPVPPASGPEPAAAADLERFSRQLQRTCRTLPFCLDLEEPIPEAGIADRLRARLAL